MNKTTSTFAIIAILVLTAVAVGAYSNPTSSQFDASGNPLVGPTVVPISTQGPSQIKEGNLGLMGTFFARGNAVFKDQVRVSGAIFGGSESAQVGARVVQVGTPGEATPTSVFVSNDVRTVDRLQTQASNVLIGGGTVPVCSDEDGRVMLCDETVVPPPPPPSPTVVLLGSSESRTTTQVYTTIGGEANRYSYLINSNYFPDDQIATTVSIPAQQELLLMTQALCRGYGPNTGSYQISVPALNMSSRAYATSQPTKPFASTNDIIYTTGTTPLNGGSNWWGLMYNGRRYVAQISSAGVIQASNNCL